MDVYCSLGNFIWETLGGKKLRVNLEICYTNLVMLPVCEFPLSFFAEQPTNKTQFDV